MSDHQNYCNNFTYDNIKDVESFSHNSESTNVREKNGDDVLIELFKQREFLYDKNDPDFKNSTIKQKAWMEISKMMIETNCGDLYTPDYCQKRCTSLREQYNREKKKMESNRSGLNFNSRRFQFYSQLTFLDKVIKRRRTYNNMRRSRSSAASDEKKYDSGNAAVCFRNNTENQHANNKQKIVDKFILLAPKSVRKKDESLQLQQTPMNVPDKTLNYVETLTLSAVDNAFIEFIKVQFASIPEHEKNMRRKMIMDALSAPL